MELVSPYFVPGKEGVAYFSALARQGIKVTILTNSLAATDVAAVHAGYAKRRKPMLEGGVVIFEMKPEFSPASTKGHGTPGSSNASLHAKTFSSDRSRFPVIAHASMSGRSTSILDPKSSTPNSAS